jgi:CubicO group peptidase (beta-lactamase class C family)
MRVGVEKTDPLTGKSQLVLEPQRLAMSVRDLLRHTAGLIYSDDGDTAVHRLHGRHFQENSVWRRDQTLAGFVTAIAKLPLAHQPGEVWEYSFAADVSARLVEVASGQPFDRFLHDRIFDPLGMVDTGFYVGEDKLSRLVDPPPGGRTGAFDVTKRPGLFSGGGGLVSTVGDYLRFAQMLLNAGELDGVRILSTETAQQMTTDAVPANVRFVGLSVGPALGASFGLGFGIRTDRALSQLPGSVGSFMWGGVWGTTFWVDPKEQLIVIQMIQVPPVMGGRYGRALRCLVYGALHDPAQDAKSGLVEVSAEALAAFIGTYDFGPQARITYTGTGMEVARVSGHATVIGTYHHGPAAKAGISAGDVVTHVDGVPAKDLAVNELTVVLPGGPIGSKVRLGIRRKGLDEALDITIVRDVVRAPAGELRVRVEGGKLLVESTGVWPVCEFEKGKVTPLLPRSSTEFYVDGGYHTRLAFLRDATGKVSGAVLNPGRFEIKGQKID